MTEDLSDKQADISEDLSDKQAEKLLDIINAFQIHFKKLFKKKDTDSMFADLDTSDPLSTNRSMEFLYDHIFKHKEYSKNNKEKNNLSNEDDNINLDDYDEFFALLINGDIDKLSASMYSLIEYLVNKYENWYEIKWEIINLKNN